MTKKREVEIKLRVRSLAEMLRRLRNLGAVRVGSVLETNALFDTASRHFQRRGAVLRIRQEMPAPPARGKAGRECPGKKTPREKTGGLLTYKAMIHGKHNKGRYKEREEIEYRIANAGRLKRLFVRLGMIAWLRYEKYRTKYRVQRFPGLHLDLDETSMGVFLELEGLKRQIDRVARLLDYGAEDYISSSYLEIYRAECRKKRAKLKGILFPTKKNR